MARMLITGAADGLGQLVARRLIEEGHEVVLHARDRQRAEDALRGAPGAADALVGDLSSIAETRELAEQANTTGRFGVVVHNAAVGDLERRAATVDGLEHVFAINTLAPYLLTALMSRPDRLIYLSSGMHLDADPDHTDLQWERRRWDSSQAYSDSKLFVVQLTFAVARRWPEVRSNAVDPGWVATKMGGPGAPGDLPLAPETQVWLATTADPGTGEYYYHREPHATHPAARDPRAQTALLAICAGLTGVELR